jgi:hypothetical protein
MNGYMDGKIYKISNELDNDIYIGSTILDLHDRLIRHRAASKIKPHYRLYKHIREIGGWGKAKIELVEEYPCRNREELQSRERYYYDKLCPVLNHTRPYVTEEERRKLTKEILLKKYVTITRLCPICNKNFKYTNRWHHENTKGHILKMVDQLKI